METIWKSEPGTLRKLAMIYYVLNKQLQKPQESLDDEMKQFEHQVLSKEEHESTERRESAAMLLSENEESSIVNKQRNISFNRQISKLLFLEKENLDDDIVIESSQEVFTPMGMVDSTSTIDNQQNEDDYNSVFHLRALGASLH